VRGATAQSSARESQPGGAWWAPSRRLGTTTATFEVVASLAAVGYADASSFQVALGSSLSAAVADGTLTAGLQASCGCADVPAAAVAVDATRAYPTLRPTPLPSPHPTPACGAGRYYRASTLACAACAAGQYRSDGLYPVSSCGACSVGTYSSAAAANCTSCLAGAYASASGSPSCASCASGTYSDSAGASSCASCAGGYFADQVQRGGGGSAWRPSLERARARAREV